jgi:futalosine hydrolase
MSLGDCEALRQAVSDCKLVLLTATEGEAEPLLRALKAAQPLVVATKKLVVGLLESGDGRAAGSAGARSVRTTLAISGCDKANAAHVITCILQASKPMVVLQVGVAGAFPRGKDTSGARVGDVVVATHEIYSDTGSTSPNGWLSAAELGLPVARVDGLELGGCFLLDTRLVETAIAAIEHEAWPEPRPRVVSGPCVTSSRVTGLLAEGEEMVRRWGAVAESMEGAAAAHICALYGVPFLEVRGISNMVVDRDRDSWQVDRAVAVAARAALAVAAALDGLSTSAPSARPESAGSSPPVGGAA